MTKYLTAALAALALLIPSSAAATTPPPAPGPWQPSAIAGCWKSTLEHHTERRIYQLSGHTFVEFRLVATVLRWCPPNSYRVVIWHTAWGPGRR